MDTNRFRLYTCDNLKELGRAYSAARLAEPQNFRLSGLFAKETVGVATQGMAVWLKQYLVRQGHVVANMEFPFIRDAIDAILSVYMKGQERYRPELFREDVLIWRIYDLLSKDSLEKEPMLEVLFSYLYGNETTARDEVRRYQLSVKLAQMYYDYMSFVPDKLHYDVLGRRNTMEPEEQWQLELWRRLCIDSQGEELISPAKAMLLFLNADAAAIRAADYAPVTFFGISAMAPYFLLVLKKLSCVQPVNFFYLNYCDELWDDVKSSWEQRHSAPDELLDRQFSNTLLGNFGVQGREFFKVVIDEMQEAELTSLASPEQLKWVAFDYEGAVRNVNIPLLADIQTRIQLNVDEEPTTRSPLEGRQDDSLTIHSCFNEFREVEALQDCLLQLIKEYDACSRPLAMNDILVMAPDISKFVPAIHAVFGQGRLKNRYCISDRSVKETNQMAETFLNILSLNKTRFEVLRVLKLLDAKPLRDKFGFDDDGVAKLRRWFQESGIRWGRDASDREGMGDFEEYSWQYGIDRMLLKLAVDAPEEGRQSLDGLQPMDFNTGAENQQLLNGLVRFYQGLKEFVAKVQEMSGQGGRTGADWCDFLMEQRAVFFQPSADYAQEFSAIGKEISELKKALIDAAGRDGQGDSLPLKPVPYEVIVSALTAAWDGLAKAEPFLNGKISFCSLLPMRGIPCKVIALLGMDVGEFPRQNEVTAYNLVTQRDENNRHRGGGLLDYYDRSRSVEDRFTFLEALMSAQDYLMIFYRGQDDQTMEKLVAAAPVNELLNYIGQIRPEAQGCAGSCQWPVVEHCLNPFSSAAFGTAPLPPAQDADGKGYTGALLQRFSFNSEMANVAVALSDKTDKRQSKAVWLEAYSLPLPKELPGNWVSGGTITISMKDLISFFKAPAERYLTARLGMPGAEWQDEKLADYEPFSLNALQSSRLQRELGSVQVLQDAFVPLTPEVEPIHRIYVQGVGEGCLPVGKEGEMIFVENQVKSWVMDSVFREQWRRQELSQEKDLEILLENVQPGLHDSLLGNMASAMGVQSFSLPEMPSFNVKVTGKIKYFDGGEDGSLPCGLRQMIFASLKGHHLIPLYIQHVLLGCALPGQELQTVFLSKDSNTGKLVSKMLTSLLSIRVSSQNEEAPDESDREDPARLQLRNLVRLYLLGHFYPLPLFADASPNFACLPAARGKKKVMSLSEDMKKDYNILLFNDLLKKDGASEAKMNVLMFLARECFSATVTGL